MESSWGSQISVLKTNGIVLQWIHLMERIMRGDHTIRMEISETKRTWVHRWTSYRNRWWPKYGDREAKKKCLLWIESEYYGRYMVADASSVTLLKSIWSWWSSRTFENKYVHLVNIELICLFPSSMFNILHVLSLLSNKSIFLVIWKAHFLILRGRNPWKKKWQLWTTENGGCFLLICWCVCTLKLDGNIICYNLWLEDLLNHRGLTILETLHLYPCWSPNMNLKCPYGSSQMLWCPHAACIRQEHAMDMACTWILQIKSEVPYHLRYIYCTGIIGQMGILNY